jgi:hypothetical protein
VSRETPLADLIPLWRTLREGEVTALVTPALDYVGGLELGGVDIRFAGEEQIGNLGEGLRSFVSSLDDDCTLLFLYKVEEGSEEDVQEYEASCADAQPAALRSYVAARAGWLRKQHFRRTRIYLFFSGSPSAKGALSRGPLGVKLLFANPGKLGSERHEKELKRLAQLRDRISGRLAQHGIQSRELALQDFWRIHHELLNPGGARARLSPPAVALRDDLWSAATIRSEGAHLSEYTEAEQLAFEDIEDGRGHFRHGGLFRRVTTLKVLPEAGTDYFAAEPLLSLASRGPAGESRPFGYTLAVALHIQPQAKARWLLNAQHGLVDALKNAIPFLSDRSVGRETADRAKQDSIAALFTELNEMSSKIVTLSASMLLEAPTLDELDAQTEAARSAFNAIGNSEMYVEDVAQIPAFLSMFPGGGGYQLRKKGCTSRNAGDFLPLFAPWRGCSRAASLLVTPSGDAFRLDLFDKRLATAHHGLVVADTGSGKSVSLGALTLDALAAGADAILIDNGNSWKALTELLGGTHLPVDIKTSISPFVEYARMLGRDGELDNESIQDVVSFLEVCVTDRGQPGFDKVETDLVGRAVRRCYEERFKGKQEERPLISAFRDALAAYPSSHPDDRAIADRVTRRLAIYCDGVYGDFLNRPSTLRFDARLLTFDLQNVSKSQTTKTIAMATIVQAITNRAAARRNRTLVEVDEGHEHLGADDVGERFLAGCYRKMRKFDVAMWMISQRFNDFLSCKAGPAIVGNSSIRIFLRHGGGHDQVIDYFKLSRRAATAFRQLEMKPGHYSDFLLMYGSHTTTVRLALHPLAYWILTTDPDDRRLLERAVEKNPDLDRLTLLEELAARYPHGAPRNKPRATAA